MCKEIIIVCFFINQLAFNSCLGQKQKDLLVYFGGEIEDYRFGCEVKDFYLIDSVGEEIRPALYTNGFNIPPLDSGFYNVCFVLQRESFCFYEMSLYSITNGAWRFSIYTKPFKGVDPSLLIDRPKTFKTMIMLNFSGMIQYGFLKQRFKS